MVLPPVQTPRPRRSTTSGITAVAAGANRIHALQMRTSELRKHRDQARLMAVRAAREKAVAIASELGQKIGRARNVQVDSPQGYWANANTTQNAFSSAGGDSSGAADFAAGQITVTGRVTVTFELE
jgi:uncharacterized protein YggE